MNKEIKILYLCDGKACEHCHEDVCKLTSDINHAIHKDDLDGRIFVAIDRGDCLVFFEKED